MEACSKRERIQTTDAGFDAETTVGDGGNEVFRQYDDGDRLVWEVTVTGRPAETRVDGYGGDLRGQE